MKSKNQIEIRKNRNDDLEQIISCYADMVYRIAFRRCKNRDDADDVFQEVFMRLVRYRHRLKNEQHIKAWLIRVTINCTKKNFVKERHRKLVPYMEELHGCCEDPFQYSDLYEAVERLSDTYRGVVCLFYFGGMSAKEIGEVLSIGEEAVRVRLYRARRILRKMLE